MKMTKAERLEEFDVVKMIAQEALQIACNKQEHFTFGHAFLWCKADIGGKRYKFLAGSIDGRENITQIETDVRNAVKEIVYTWTNMD